MIKITTCTGKEYTISKNTDLEALANELHRECTNNDEGYGDAFAAGYSRHKLPRTTSFWEEDAPAEGLWSLLNVCDYLNLSKRIRVRGRQAEVKFGVTKEFLFIERNSNWLSQFHELEVYTIKPEAFAK